MKLKIKTWDAMAEEFGINDLGYIKCELTFIKDMEELLPEDRIISAEYYPDYNYFNWFVKDGDDYGWTISYDMVEEEME